MPLLSELSSLNFRFLKQNVHGQVFLYALSINTIYNGWANNYVFVLRKQTVLMDGSVLFAFKDVRNSTWDICFCKNSIGIPSDSDSQFELAPKPTQMEELKNGTLNTSNYLWLDDI